MAYPTISYNVSTGSTTNPSDCVASSVGTSVTAGGTASGTTITFDFEDSELTSLDLSSCADDGSDYIWVNLAWDDRRLFQITAFSPSKAACTSVTVATGQEIDTTFSGEAWHINGTRQQIYHEIGSGYGSDRLESQDWCRGWTIELDGTFDVVRVNGPWNAYFMVAQNDTAPNAKDDPTLTIKPSSSASSRPKVRTTNGGTMLTSRESIPIKVIGIDLEHFGTGGGDGYVHAQFGPLTLIDCKIENNSTVQPTNGVVQQGGWGNSIRLYNCYIKGGANYVVSTTTGSGSDGIIIDNCWLDCQGTYGTTAAVEFANDSCVLSNTLITDAAGAGVLIDDSNSIQRDAHRTIKNCTITGCGGDGITYTGSGSGSDTNATQMTTILNTLITDCTGYAVDLDGFSLPPDPGYIDYNCMFNNSSGSYNGVDAGPNDVTITTTPFTDAANDDYSLNNTATGGALLRDAALYDLPTEP